MPINRSLFQSDETLQEFYQREDWKGPFKSSAENMLALLDMLNEMFVETQLWAITSHQRLCLLSKNTKNLDWVLIISNMGLKDFYIEYQVPDHKGPWPNAWMRGMAPSLEDARIYILKAMRNCEVWDGNEELEKLLKMYLV